MTPEQKQEYKDGIDSALALLMEFRTALDNPPRGIRSCCAYCDEVFDEVESGKCPPDLLEHAKTCVNSPHAKEIERMKGKAQAILDECHTNSDEQDTIYFVEEHRLYELIEGS